MSTVGKLIRHVKLFLTELNKCGNKWTTAMRNRNGSKKHAELRKQDSSESI